MTRLPFHGETEAILGKNKMKKRDKSKLDVEYFHKGKRPIAYSTKAVSDSLAYFKPLANSWEELKGMLPYGFDEKRIIDCYIKAGADYNDIIFK